VPLGLDRAAPVRGRRGLQRDRGPARAGSRADPGPGRHAM